MRQIRTKEIMQRRILVVDDEKNIRFIFSQIISSIGFEVAVAESGDKALNQFLKSPFDLVFTDLKMPGMDGWTLAYHIKKISLETPIILITGEEREQILKKKEESSVDSVLFKPVQLQDIQKILHRMLDKP